ncbi:DsbA family protein [Deinococcus roseus]|uniref:Thioredoxin-like fold domain-containing protein n=1 Tax=Deinococcus roseus TaxID=392414 RepID=A0ABQ2D6S5_9DEIO|nr:thioredoxin domain-containing protein [Deinococcus roseus]GGJ48025.1 hypothetical protein GCM10008938_37550 [Deinococcus roseus]
MNEQFKNDKKFLTSVGSGLVVFLVCATAFAGTLASSQRFRVDPALGTTLGSPTAKVVVTEFIDLNCQHCKAFQPMVGPILKKHLAAGEIRLQYVNVAFLHQDSKLGLRYEACIRKDSPALAGAFVQEVLSHQTSNHGVNTAKVYLQSYRQAGGTQEKALKQCVQKTSDQEAEGNLDYALKEVGLKGTPTLLVNGKSAGFSASTLKQLIAEQLQEAKHE